MMYVLTGDNADLPQRAQGIRLANLLTMRPTKLGRRLVGWSMAKALLKATECCMSWTTLLLTQQSRSIPSSMFLATKC
jgi:hypothetical protein